MTLRQAALTAGFAYLLNPVSYPEFSLYPRLVIPGKIEQTAQNISAHPGVFVAIIFCFLISFIGDVVIAWALYFLLAPVNRAISLLAAWFHLIYTAVGLAGLLNLVTAWRMLHDPDYITAFGRGPLYAQLKLLLGSFHPDWSFALLIFGIHLCLLGYLICRSGYIPFFLGILLVINGLGWIEDGVQPYLFPDAHLGFISITFLGELVFMV